MHGMRRVWCLTSAITLFCVRRVLRQARGAAILYGTRHHFSSNAKTPFHPGGGGVIRNASMRDW